MTDKWLTLRNDEDDYVAVVYVVVGYDDVIDGGDDGIVDYELYVYTICQFQMDHRVIFCLHMRGSKNNAINMF